MKNMILFLVLMALVPSGVFAASSCEAVFYVNGVATINHICVLEDEELMEDVYGTITGSGTDDVILKDKNITGGNPIDLEKGYEAMGDICDDPAVISFFENISSGSVQDFISYMKALGYDDETHISIIWSLCQEKTLKSTGDYISQKESEWSDSGVDEAFVERNIENAVSYIYSEINSWANWVTQSLKSSIEKQNGLENRTIYLENRIDKLENRIGQLESYMNFINFSSYDHDAILNYMKETGSHNIRIGNIICVRNEVRNLFYCIKENETIEDSEIVLVPEPAEINIIAFEVNPVEPGESAKGVIIIENTGDEKTQFVAVIDNSNVGWYVSPSEIQSEISGKGIESIEFEFSAPADAETVVFTGRIIWAGENGPLSVETQTDAEIIEMIRPSMGITGLMLKNISSVGRLDLYEILKNMLKMLDS